MFGRRGPGQYDEHNGRGFDPTFDERRADNIDDANHHNNDHNNDHYNNHTHNHGNPS